MILAITGVVLSVPFLPPRDAEMRPYAAAIPFLALLVALGGAQVGRGLHGRPHGEASGRRSAGSLGRDPGRWWVIGGFAMIATIFAGTLLIRATARPPQFPGTPPCGPGSEATYARLTPGSILRLDADVARSTTQVPVVRTSDFRAGLRDFDPVEVAVELRGLLPGDTLANAYLLDRGTSALLVTPSALVPARGGVAAICGRAWRTHSGWLFFRADLVQTEG
jgi:hypothetical protein